MLVNKEQKLRLKQEEFDDFISTLERIDKEKPCSEDVAKIEKILRDNPYLWGEGYGLSEVTLSSYIWKLLDKSKKEQMLALAEGRYIKEQLGYSASSQMERLIIDQILLCWVGVIFVEWRLMILMTGGSHTAVAGEYWQNTLTRYQNRYLRAIEMLARVRKLNKGIAFQVNIATDGGQQVNVNEVNKEP